MSEELRERGRREGRERVGGRDREGERRRRGRDEEAGIKEEGGAREDETLGRWVTTTHASPPKSSVILSQI